MDASCTIDIRNVETVPDQITSGDSPRNVIVDSPDHVEDSPDHVEDSPGHIVDLGEEEDSLGGEQLVDVPSSLANTAADVNLLLLHSNGVSTTAITFIHFVYIFNKYKYNANKLFSKITQKSFLLLSQ